MLKIIISPAKKMNLADDYPVQTGAPQFLERTEELKAYLQSLDYDTLKRIWKCNDKITAQNVERLRDMNLCGRVMPAVLAYEGIQYQSMASAVMALGELDYIGEHLNILSGFYGVLRAFDGVVPYRLEMQAKLAWSREDGVVTSLYDYWGDSLYRAVAEGGTDVIVNLASKEYSKAIEPWIAPEVRLVTCLFGELGPDGQSGMIDQAGSEGSRGGGTGGGPTIRVKATAAKMARGSMVRFMAENRVTDVEQMKEFNRMGYRYLEGLSDERTLIFGVRGQG